MTAEVFEDVLKKIRANAIAEVCFSFAGYVNVVELAEALRGNHTVIRLILYGVYMGHDEARLLCDAIADKSIERLIFCGCHLGVDGVKAVADFVKCNETITHLDVSANKFLAEGTRALAEALRLKKSVREVSVSMNEIGRDGALVLADLASTNQSLTKFNIGCNDLDVEGAKAFLGGLSFNRTLADLISLTRT